MAMRVRYTVLDGELVSEKRSGVERDYVPDPLGSTVALLDNTQAQTDAFTYWPYGEERTRTGTTGTPFRFVGTGGYYRDSSSRIYVRARHFDPVAGRWRAPDPYGSPAAGDSRYCYASDRPTSVVDISGLQPDPIGPWTPPDPTWELVKCIWSILHPKPPGRRPRPPVAHPGRRPPRPGTPRGYIPPIPRVPGVPKPIRILPRVFDCTKCAGEILDLASRCNQFMWPRGDPAEIPPVWEGGDPWGCHGNELCIRRNCINWLKRQSGADDFVKWCLVNCAHIPIDWLGPGYPK